jgi:hypothetical protein
MIVLSHKEGDKSVEVCLSIHKTQKRPHFCDLHNALQKERSHLCDLSAVVWGGIEPPTQGFSVLCSTD